MVSADGLPMAVSEGLDRDAADRFAAVASGPHRPGLRRRRPLRRRRGHQIIIEMEHAFLFVTGISDGSLPRRGGRRRRATSAWSATRWRVLVDRAGTVLTPELRAELQGALPR